jgi:hypothetical protein
VAERFGHSTSPRTSAQIASGRSSARARRPRVRGADELRKEELLDAMSELHRMAT